MISKILITGGTGFVGQNTAKLFADAGTAVVITSRKENDPVAQELLGYSDLISVVKVDLSQEHETAKLFSEHGFDGMIMLAQTHQTASSRAEINHIYPITVNCLEQARVHGVKRVVLGSSIAVYGGVEPSFTEDKSFNPSIEFTENTPFQLPRNEVRIKRIVEELCLDYAVPMEAATSAKEAAPQQHELELAILRLPMQFGPGYRYGGNPLSIACHAAAGNLGDLVNQVGYLNATVPVLWNMLGLFRPLYVKDSALALKAVMDAETLPRTIYNVASELSNSARKQYQAVQAAAPNATDRLNIPMDTLSDEESDVGFNGQRMFEDFGWKSSYTLEGACQEYVDWLVGHDL